MGASPEWKVHNADGEYKACCKDVEDAGVLAELYGVGASIKNRHWGRRPLYVVRELVGPDEIARRITERCDEELADMSITSMTPDQIGEVVKAETNQIMASACGIYPGMEVRHVKSGGDYIVVCEATIEATMTPAVVYRSKSDDKVWVRPTREFCDGRFVGA